MKRASVFLIIVGLLVAGYPLAERVYTWYWQQRILCAWDEVEQGNGGSADGGDRESPSDASVPAEAPASAPGPTPVGILIIDKIDMRLPIMEGTGGGVLWIGAGVWEGGAAIGEEGNTVITSHRVHTYGRLFNRLDELEPGDEIVIETRSGGYSYTVYEREIVPADAVTLTQPGEGKSMLTLITCHPLNRVNAPDRLVVKARATGGSSGASVDSAAGGDGGEAHVG